MTRVKPLMQSASALKFQASGAFHRDLKQRVDGYFSETRLRRRDLPCMYLKTVIILAWFAASWSFLVFSASSVGGALAGCVSLALAMAGIGFSVQHDANHGSYSESSRVNSTVGALLDLVGGSSYIWRWKHNVFHHSQPNVVGLDADLNVGGLARLAPEQRWHKAHRGQHLYLWVLYGFLAVKWHLLDDVVDVATGHVGGRKMPRPTGWALTRFASGKLAFLGWAFVVPALFHPVWKVALAYILTAVVLGIVLAVTFQLAHCVDEAEFPVHPGRDAPAFDSDWAVHQVRTTVDFAQRNRLLTWYLGGLNFQVVHHLFPKVCHLHYPALARILESTCQSHGLRYRIHPSLRSAIVSHFRWLKRMGSGTEARGQA